MDIAARTNALDDLLPHITSLIEVECPVLLRLLRQVPLTNVDAVCGDAGLNPLQLKCLVSNRRGACRQQRAPAEPAPLQHGRAHAHDRALLDAVADADAARAEATLGEICDALREVWGVYQPAEIT